MNWLDIAIVLLIVTSVASSIMTGFARELISLGALVFGILSGLWLYPDVADMLRPYTASMAIASFAAFFLILAASLLLGWIISKIAGALVKAGGLRWFDRVLGAAFGLVRGVLTSAVLVLGIVAFLPGPGPTQSVASSRFAPSVLYGARVVVAFAPRSLKDGFDSGLQRVRDHWSGVGARDAF